MKPQKLRRMGGWLLLVSATLSLTIISRAETPNLQDRRLGLEPAESVKVALLLPAADKQNCQAAGRGAKMAIADANKNGGFQGRPFQLMVCSLTGLWGAGSKEIVRVAHDENVWAILSWLDGRSAHLVEQIVTKTQIALISTRATDPTLTQINIPWFFSLVPDDQEQAKILAREIVQVRGLKRLATMTEETYDARKATEVFGKVVSTFGTTRPVLLAYSEIKADPCLILREIKQNEIESIVFLGQFDAAADFVRLMKKGGMAQPIFAPMNLLNSDFSISKLPALEKVVLVAPGHLVTSRGKAFQKAYLNCYGYQPGAAAAYAYDAIGVIVEAIRRGGLNRQKIRDALKNINYGHGVTGTIHFDTNGRRQGPFNLIKILKGRPKIH